MQEWRHSLNWHFIFGMNPSRQRLQKVLLDNKRGTIETCNQYKQTIEFQLPSNSLRKEKKFKENPVFSGKI